MTLHGLPSFYAPWLLALAASSAGDGATPGAITVRLEGTELPVLQLALALAGVLMARPLAPRREQERGIGRQILVTLIMMVLASVWVIESQPGLLFTFVVAIGLGFSGYALIELAGTQIEHAAKRLFATISDALASIGGKSK